MRDGTSRRADKPIDARASRLGGGGGRDEPSPEIIPSKICKGSCGGIRRSAARRRTA